MFTNYKPEAGVLVNPSPGSSAFSGWIGFRCPLKSWLIRARIAGNIGIFADFDMNLGKNGLNSLVVINFINFP